MYYFRSALLEQTLQLYWVESVFNVIIRDKGKGNSYKYINREEQFLGLPLVYNIKSNLKDGLFYALIVG